MKQSFDLIIIGGGPGGYHLAAKASEKGLKVALVEQNSDLGGTCLNRGCIPTKALLASANAYKKAKSLTEYGINSENISFNWEKIQNRKDQIIKKLNDGIFKLLSDRKVSIFNGFAKLYKDKTVKISDNEEITGNKICICSGSVPFIPGFIPKNKEIFWSSDEALSTKELPKTLLIVGGGVIGLELGQVFNEFGTKVSIVEMAPQILPGLDTATAKRLLPTFKKFGIDIQTGKKVESLVEKDNHVFAVISGVEKEFDKALICVGRRANLSFMSDTDCQLETENGFIKINNLYETSEKDIFAIGDCVKGPMLAHKATYDANILINSWFGKVQRNPDYSMVPACVYTYPEISWIGLSEEKLKEQNIAYKVGRSMFSANGKAVTLGESEGQIKIMLSPVNKLLGAVIWGPEASVLIHEAAVLANLKADCSDINFIIHAHPTLSESFVEAVENAVQNNIQ